MSIHPAILYRLYKESSFATSSNDDSVSDYIGGEVVQVWESKEAYIESMTRDAMTRHVEKKRREVLHAIKNDLIVPMPVPEDIEGYQPPAKASCFLSRLLDDRDKEIVLGDLTEQYILKVEHVGKRRADGWFYVEVARSLWPLAKRSVAKAVRFAMIGEWIRRMIK
ncbi:MAG TPA: permease prefix domain 2-containing transporter [Pyrinomonadaceae bacterium]|jgi:hypothetical protein|nr:permease prefix domain 2-containing transporter [Pyrinomonadaceae bacterium]